MSHIQCSLQWTQNVNLMKDRVYPKTGACINQYIKDSKVEICRGGRSTIAVEVIAVEMIAVEAIAVETITVEAITVHPGGSINDHC